MSSRSRSDELDKTFTALMARISELRRTNSIVANVPIEISFDEAVAVVQRIEELNCWKDSDNLFARARCADKAWRAIRAGEATVAGLPVILPD